ncbi:hypothetical protein [Streptomyces justiciae]|uniref:hypothetical protein n=1 Tax=Streptomyces justiciae TaxID=2780140 RepID=UPI001880C995|nr:hypothetical protein [Streptomyces justiciae]MBE8471491.1 hypothetical protein [Streptomyces justiciae]MCW8381987.1 hypothetical protein [Streptomyces justiciae]
MTTRQISRPAATTDSCPPTTTPESLRTGHAERTRSAYARAEAACRHAGIGPDAVELVPKSPAGRAAHSLRLSAHSTSTLAASAPAPAADARCARNVAAAAALAAQAAAQTHDANNHESSQENDDRPGSLSNAAFRTVLKASQAAEAARSAGWMRPPRS